MNYRALNPGENINEDDEFWTSGRWVKHSPLMCNRPVSSMTPCRRPLPESVLNDGNYCRHCLRTVSTPREHWSDESGWKCNLASLVQPNATSPLPESVLTDGKKRRELWQYRSAYHEPRYDSSPRYGIEYEGHFIEVLPGEPSPQPENNFSGPESKDRPADGHEPSKAGEGIVAALENLERERQNVVSWGTSTGDAMARAYCAAIQVVQKFCFPTRPLEHPQPERKGDTPDTSTDYEANPAFDHMPTVERSGGNVQSESAAKPTSGAATSVEEAENSLYHAIRKPGDMVARCGFVFTTDKPYFDSIPDVDNVCHKCAVLAYQAAEGKVASTQAQIEELSVDYAELREVSVHQREFEHQIESRDAEIARLKEERETACNLATLAANSSLEAERQNAQHVATIVRLLNGMEVAWGIIANAGGGDWFKETLEWQRVAAVWRDNHWHQALDTAKTQHVATIEQIANAARRLLDGKYVTWTFAGGGEQCEHGYNTAIPCPACDLAMINSALDTVKTQPKGTNE